MYWHEYSTNVQCVKVSGSVTHGLCKVRISYSLYTDFADYTELFRKITEGTVFSVCSVYKNRVLSSDFATAT